MQHVFDEMEIIGMLRDYLAETTDIEYQDSGDLIPVYDQYGVLETIEYRITPAEDESISGGPGEGEAEV